MKKVTFCILFVLSGLFCAGFSSSDINKDGTVNFQDLAIMGLQWLQEDSNTVPTGATITVASSEALQRVKDNADFVCDGTDDQVEIQTAIDMLIGKGGCVVLSHGKFYISGHIYLHDRIGLAGQNLNTTVIKAINGFTGDLVIWQPLSQTVTEYYAHLQKLKIDGNDEKTSGTGLITRNNVYSSPSDFYMDHVMISNCDNGADFQESWGYKITNCLFEYNRGRGINIAGSGQVIVQGCFIAYNQGEYGVHLGSVSNPVQIIGCFFNANSNHQLMITASGHIVNGCVFQHSSEVGDGKHCILIDLKAHDTIISNNKINGKEKAGYGIRVRSNNNIITGNYISNCVTEAISNEGQGNLINNNIGYKTENSGFAQVSNGGVIEHGLAIIPTYVNVNAVQPGHYATVQTADEQYITINLTDYTGTPVDVNEGVYWQAIAR